jgi:hypothetical protein
MASIGSQLRREHTFLGNLDRQSTMRFESNTGDAVIASGFPKFHHETIWINPHAGFAGVSECVWNWRVGSHHVCRKWLASRRQRELQPADIAHYERILNAIMTTQRLTLQLDNTIAECGGIEGAFK